MTGHADPLGVAAELDRLVAEALLDPETAPAPTGPNVSAVVGETPACSRSSAAAARPAATVPVMHPRPRVLSGRFQDAVRGE
jgi:hypothetical protein